MPDIPNGLAEALKDRYTIQRELGHGGMATVYLATDRKHEREVAIKVLQPDVSAAVGAERFLREIKTTAQLNHPNILPLYDSGRAGGLAGRRADAEGAPPTEFLFYVMPYIEGDSLREKMTREGQMSLEETIAIARDVASALDYAHERGIVHRDIKPENILLQREHALVADFGIALATRTTGGARLTEMGASLGTPHYMSPEQLSGERDVDGRADIYSLGAVVYEMLTGDPPYTGHTLQAIVARILSSEPVPIRGIRSPIPAHVDAAVARALAKAPADRFQTATAFVDAMRGKGDRAAGAWLGALGQPLSNRSLRVGLGIAAGVLIVIGALIVGRAVRGTNGPGATMRPAPRWMQLTFVGDVRASALSPDGQSFAYVAGQPGEQRLMLQEVGGASATEVGTYRFVSSPSWSSDGRLVFRADGGTYVLPRFGETPRAIAAAGLPRWSPDGTRIVSIEQPRGPRGRPGRVLFTSLATAETTSVALPDTLETNEGMVTDLAWSPNGESLAFEVRENPRQGGGPFTLWEMATDGSRLTSLISEQSRFCLSWPVEAKALYLLAGNNQGQELRTMVVGARSHSAPDVVLGGLRDVDRNTDPCVSLTADGTRLLFTQVQQIANLWRLSPGDTERPEQLTTGTQLVADPVVSPDGRQVAYTAYNPTQGGNVFTVPVAGGSPKQVTVGGGGFAAWSPDGREIAFVSSRGGVRRVWIVSSDGGVERTVGQPTEGAIAWAPGPHILYRPGDDSLFHALDPTTGDDHSVPGTEGLSRPVPSPDGTHVAMLLRRRQNAVVIVSLATGERTTAYDSDRRAPVAPIRWSNDGAALFMYEVQDTTSRILRVSARGGAARTVLTLPYNLSAGFPPFLGLGPDARDVVYRVLDSRSDVWLIENVGGDGSGH